jgi:hypothetical protein
MRVVLSAKRRRRPGKQPGLQRSGGPGGDEINVRGLEAVNGERVKLEPRRMYTSLRNDASNGTEVFRVPRDYALKTLGKTFDQNICDGALAPTARPLF